MVGQHLKVYFMPRAFRTTFTIHDVVREFATVVTSEIVRKAPIKFVSEVVGDVLCVNVIKF